MLGEGFVSGEVGWDLRCKLEVAMSVWIVLKAGRCLSAIGKRALAL